MRRWGICIRDRPAGDFLLGGTSPGQRKDRRRHSGVAPSLSVRRCPRSCGMMELEEGTLPLADLPSGGFPSVSCCGWAVAKMSVHHKKSIPTGDAFAFSGSLSADDSGRARCPQPVPQQESQQGRESRGHDGMDAVHGGLEDAQSKEAGHPHQNGAQGAGRIGLAPIQASSRGQRKVASDHQRQTG